MSTETVFIHHCDQCNEELDERTQIACIIGSGYDGGFHIDTTHESSSDYSGGEFCSAECFIKHLTAFVNNFMTEVQHGKHT